MVRFMEHLASGLDLSSPSTPEEHAMVVLVEMLWQKMEVLGILVPRNTNATWHNIPDLGKAAGFMECEKLKIPWNVFEYHDKAVARLGKLRSKGLCCAL